MIPPSPATPEPQAPITPVHQVPPEPTPQATNTMDIDPDLKTLGDSIVHGTSNMLITGYAGTGKSTLLKYVRDTTPQRHGIVAPTGLAAINVGGRTPNSFFGFDLCRVAAQGVPTNKKIKANLDTLELLIIDEVSMLAPDTIDGIDRSLRHHRDGSRPFGGLRVLLFGDPFQLDPIVATPPESEYILDHYGTNCFHAADVFHKASLECIELRRNMRQREDHTFFDLLTRIRHNDGLDGDMLAVLNERVADPGYILRPDCDPSTIMLSPDRARAAHINAIMLDRLPGPTYPYKGYPWGIFPPDDLPTDTHIQLRAGAKIIMLKRSSQYGWVNGSRGTIISLGEETIHVDTEHGSGPVPFETWPHFTHRYFDHSIRAKKDGWFSQYPVAPAWALTIHKSQGQTCPKVFLDLTRDPFAPGQLYVALSRCSSLAGLTLSREVVPNDVKVHPDAIGYKRIVQNTIVFS